jgi:hypothetical protein
MTWAIAKRPSTPVVSTYDPRNPAPACELFSQRLLAAAKQDGTENEPTLVRLVKALEKSEAGPLVDESEGVFIEYELEAAVEAYNRARRTEQ